MLRIYVWVGGRGCVGHEHLLRLLVWVQWGNKAMEGARLVLCPLCTVKKTKTKSNPKKFKQKKEKKEEKKTPNIITTEFSQHSKQLDHWLGSGEEEVRTQVYVGLWGESWGRGVGDRFFPLNKYLIKAFNS